MDYVVMAFGQGNEMLTGAVVTFESDDIVKDIEDGIGIHFEIGIAYSLTKDDYVAIFKDYIYNNPSYKGMFKWVSRDDLVKMFQNQ